MLALLIGMPAGLVSRDEIQRRLWRDSIFVDFEHGINFSIIMPKKRWRGQKPILFSL